MKSANKLTRATAAGIRPPLTINVEIEPLVEIVRRHAKLSEHAARLLRGDFARLFHSPSVRGNSRSVRAKDAVSEDAVLSTQAAADLIGVSRPYLVARIEAGDIPLHQQVGNQRRVLKSDVLSWQRREQARRRRVIGQLAEDLDSEIFAARKR